MADDVLIKNGTGAGTDFTAATDEIGGKHYQRMKVGHGADGSYADASASAPLPVEVVSVADLNNGAQTNVSTSAVQLIAADAARVGLIVQNVGTTGSCRVGAASVTATTGTRLDPGDWVAFDGSSTPTNAVYAIRDGGADATVLAQGIAR